LYWLGKNPAWLKETETATGHLANTYLSSDFEQSTTVYIQINVFHPLDSHFKKKN
jgi:hypothetical protein